MLSLYNCGIYQIRNILNNKCYVGQSVSLQKRKEYHFRTLKNNKHHNSHLQNSYNKYKKENFIFEILLYCESFELTRYEDYFDKKYKKLYLSYNVRPSADSNIGIRCSDEKKQKLSEINTGENHPQFGIPKTDEIKQKISKSNKKRAQTEETKKRYSEAHLGEKNYWFGKKQSDETKKKNSISNSGSSNAFYGKHHSEETKLKMRDAKKNISEETRKKISESRKGKIQSKESIEKRRKKMIGRIILEETRKKISESLKKYWKNRKENIDNV